MKRRFALILALVIWVCLAKFMMPNSKKAEAAKVQTPNTSSQLADTQ